MSFNEPVTHDVQGSTDDGRAATMGVLSLAIGLVAALGGGTLANAIQYWAFDIASRNNGIGTVAQAMAAVPPILLGIAAIALGLNAAKSPQTVASATGKAGAVMGVLAIAGGVLLGVTLLRSDFF